MHGIRREEKNDGGDAFHVPSTPISSISWHPLSTFKTFAQPVIDIVDHHGGSADVIERFTPDNLNDGNTQLFILSSMDVGVKNYFLIISKTRAQDRDDAIHEAKPTPDDEADWCTT